MVSEIIQEVKARGAGGTLSEGKSSLIKNDVAQDDNLVGIKIKAAVSLMMSGVAKEDTKSRTRCELVCSGG